MHLNNRSEQHDVSCVGHRCLQLFGVINLRQRVMRIKKVAVEHWTVGVTVLLPESSF